MTAAVRAALLAVLGLLLAGCPPVLVEFIYDDDDTAPDDDDDDDSGDDDDSTLPEAPILVDAWLVEDVSPLVGEVAIGFLVADADSESVSVAVSFAAGPSEAFANATTSGATTVAGGPPVDGDATFTWDTAADVPEATSAAVLKLCPEDDGGLAGECFELTDLVVFNQHDDWTGAFCQPGHVEGTAWFGGQAFVPLSDGECLNYQETDPPSPDDFAAQFLVTLVNPHDEPVGFTVGPTAAELPSTPGEPPPAPSGGDSVGLVPAESACVPDLDDTQVLNDGRTFRIRESIVPDSAREPIGATLMALGESIAVFVDNETPIDRDYDCADPESPVWENDLPAFGFDNCDLQEVVDLFDATIYPTITTLYGVPSDVDANCRVKVLVSHRLNGLSATDEDPDNDAFVVKSFAEPAIDLFQTNLLQNPHSNEGELLYVYAPDPAGLWGDEEVQLADYLDFHLAGQLAIALQDLVSYAAHVGVGDELLPVSAAVGDPEDDWLNDALGLLAADLSGFGAVAYAGAWSYLDRPHLLPLTEANTLGDFEDRGGAYLFARYLHDVYGDGILYDLVHSTTTGAASLEAATGVPFAALASDWALAMGVTGRVNEAGGQLVSDAVLAQFQAPSFVDDVQHGFAVRGLNFTHGWSGGGDVLTANLDPLVYHPQSEFSGSVAGGYGVVAFVVGGLGQEVNSLLIETSTGLDLYGSVVRLNDDDPHAPALTLEDVDGALLTTVRPLDEGLPLDAWPEERRVIGRIDPPEPINVVQSFDPTAPSAGLFPSMVVGDVYDTDRYSFSLGATATLGIQADRRFSDATGGVALSDLFLAVVPHSDLPDPWNYDEWSFGPTDAWGACSDAVWFDYPNVVPDWVFTQGVPGADAFTAAALYEPVTDWAEEDGIPLEVDAFSCTYDHDQDLVPDWFEGAPASLMDQVQQRQAEHLAADPEFYADPWGLLPDSDLDPTAPFFGTSFFDMDTVEFPDDDRVTSLPSLGIGGRAVPGGEEAVWTGTLPPGDYIVVVGADGGGTGPYDLSVRVLD